MEIYDKFEKKYIRVTQKEYNKIKDSQYWNIRYEGKENGNR